jgi:predicted MFS family arabinose efflux permease
MVIFYSARRLRIFPANPVNSNVGTPLWVVAGLSLGPAAGLGLGRFAYALLLPAMREALSLSYAAAGELNAANAAGYLAGALLATTAARRLGVKRAFFLAMVLTAAVITATGLTTSFAVLMTLRLVAGLSGGVAFVVGGAMAAAAGGGSARAPLILGLFFSGAGSGIAISALAVPTLLDTVGWRGGWLVLGALAAAAAVAVIPALMRAPLPATQPRGAANLDWPLRKIGIQLIGYGLFGAGYIAYATFIIAHLRTASQFAARDISLFWALLGCSAIAGVFAWGPLLVRLRGGWGAVVTMGAATLGAALPLASPASMAAYASAILFGGSFLSTITAVTSLARRAAPPEAWTKAIAALTVAFGIGQCIGPVLSGYLSDGPDGVRTGLQLSAVIMILALVTSAFQREVLRDQ